MTSCEAAFGTEGPYSLMLHQHNARTRTYEFTNDSKTCRLTAVQLDSTLAICSTGAL